MEPAVTLSRPPAEYPAVLALERVIAHRSPTSVDRATEPTGPVGQQPAETATQGDLGSHIKAATAVEITDSIMHSGTDLQALRARILLEFTSRDRAWFNRVRAATSHSEICDQVMARIVACIEAGDFEGAKQLAKGR
jgi:hypothetical protein